MAKEKTATAWERYEKKIREKEEEEEEEAEETLHSVVQKNSYHSNSSEVTPNQIARAAREAKIEELIDRAAPLIEQVNNLYGQYISGVGKTPPVVQQKQLDQLMQTIMFTAKPTKSIQYQASELQNRYNIYKNRWEKLLKDAEVGKSKRR